VLSLAPWLAEPARVLSLAPWLAELARVLSLYSQRERAAIPRRLVQLVADVRWLHVRVILRRRARHDDRWQRQQQESRDKIASRIVSRLDSA